MSWVGSEKNTMVSTRCFDQYALIDFLIYYFVASVQQGQIYRIKKKKITEATAFVALGPFSNHGLGSGSGFARLCTQLGLNLHFQRVLLIVHQHAEPEPEPKPRFEKSPWSWPWCPFKCFT